MKLQTLTVAAPKQFGTAGQNEKKDARLVRMQAYWAAPENAVMIPVGKLLATMADAKRTIAQALVDGETVELPDSLIVDGKSLPLAANTVLSLANVNAWGCIACHSAHGSGMAPSRDVSAKLLLENKFFYNPSTKAINVISNDCLNSYVKDIGATLTAAGAPRFVSPGNLALTTSKATAPPVKK